MIHQIKCEAAKAFRRDGAELAASIKTRGCGNYEDADCRTMKEIEGLEFIKKSSK